MVTKVVTNGVAKPNTDATNGNGSKKAVVVLDYPDKRKSCKGSVRFAVKPSVKNPITDNLYVDRLAAMTALGIADLDAENLVGVKVTVEPVYA